MNSKQGTVSNVSSARTHRRRQYYIQGSFQRRFLLKFCGVILLGCLVFGTLLYWYGSQTLTTAFVHSRLRVLTTSDYLFPALAWATVIVGALTAAGCAAMVLLLSHKIAGPLYRLEQVMHAIGNGDLAQSVKLRERDELKAMAGAMDAMVRQLRTRVSSVKQQAKVLEGRLQSVSREAGSSAEALPRLEEDLRQLNAMLAQFRS